MQWHAHHWHSSCLTGYIPISENLTTAKWYVYILEMSSMIFGPCLETWQLPTSQSIWRIVFLLLPINFSMMNSLLKHLMDHAILTQMIYHINHQSLSTMTTSIVTQLLEAEMIWVGIVQWNHSFRKFLWISQDSYSCPKMSNSRFVIFPDDKLRGSH